MFHFTLIFSTWSHLYSKLYGLFCNLLLVLKNYWYLQNSRRLFYPYHSYLGQNRQHSILLANFDLFVAQATFFDLQILFPNLKIQKKYFFFMKFSFIFCALKRVQPLTWKYFECLMTYETKLREPSSERSPKVLSFQFRVR